MTKDLEYYINRTKNQCVTVPSRKDDYLVVSNYLSEFGSEEEKQLAQDNLGITEKLNQLKQIFDGRVIDRGCASYDLEPIEGNVYNILSSDALWRLIQKYYTKEEIDQLIQNMWSDLNTKINNISNTIYDQFSQEYGSNFINKLDELEQKLNSLLDQNITGIPVVNALGDGQSVGVSQKTLTDAINNIWNKLSELTGENYQGINMTVTPEYFIGESGCDVHITATTENTSGIFESIRLYLDGDLLTTAENVEYLEYDISINKTSVLMCKAKILGVEYTQQKTIIHYNSFWLGSGSSDALPSSIMTLANIIPITNGMKGNYNVLFNANDHLYVIVGESLREGFSRADMNGMEIPMTESTFIDSNGNTYRVFKSENPYLAGTYNIDINS